MCKYLIISSCQRVIFNGVCYKQGCCSVAMWTKVTVTDIQLLFDSVSVCYMFCILLVKVFFTGTGIRRQKWLLCLSKPKYACLSEPNSNVNVRKANNIGVLLVILDSYKYNTELTQTNKLKIFRKICGQQSSHHLKLKSCIISFLIAP